MAKINFSKLGLKTKTETKILTFMDNEIEIKQFLPMQEKTILATNVLNYSADENSFKNYFKVKVFKDLEIIYAYTNIAFTEKQKEDPAKLHDVLNSNGLIDLIYSSIPKEEINEIDEAVSSIIDCYYGYKNSILGILEKISTDYSNLKLDAEEIQSMLANPENMSFLKDVVSKLG